jgi:phosphopantothenoylcysteine decarboxylase/phosphopantothenate--cysteine ligase
MTRHAQEFVTPLTLQTLAGEPVSTELFDLTQESEIGHIRLADTADAVVVAPATANVIGKLAAGIADDLLTTVLLATRAPVLIAPSMNVHMFENPLVQANLERLRQLGRRIVAPAVGYLACGYEGAGRLADPEVIVAETERAVGPNDFAGERVLVTAGPNREAIDPVRFISNRSTGKMGYALAAAAWRRGAEVVLISGPTALAVPHGVRCVAATTAAEMRAAVGREIGAARIVLMAAAVADYRPAKVSPQKIKKGPGGLTIDLERTVDILSEISRRPRRPVIVGFAAETEHVIENARRKLAEKRVDMVVANDVTGADTGFESDTNEVIILTPGAEERVPLAGKDEIADSILDHVRRLRERKAAAPKVRLVRGKPARRGRA